ncbi:hypothetical protein D3C71_832040 [compost metagenome]
MTVCPLTADNVTVNVAVTVPALPSVTVVSLMDSEGTASSLTIVPVPWPSATVAPVTLLTLTRKVSLGSCNVSPLTSTVKVALLLPAAMVCPVSAWAT